jgi:hypothetical protein
MPSEFGEFVEEEDAMMGQRHLARHGHLAAADQSHIGDWVTGGATRPGGDKGGACDGVSRTSGSAIADRIVVSGRANTDVPAFAGLSNR